MDSSPSTLARRTFLLGTAAATAFAFDPIRRSWLTEAQAHGHPNVPTLPSLDGELLTDAASLANAADDYGHFVHRTPRAVLRPGSINDVVEMVRFCKRHRIEIAMRGQAHSTHGQAQVEAGIVIDSSTLSDVSLHGNSAIAGPGALWRQIVATTLPAGLTPPVLPNYLDLTIGGQIAVGGIGGAGHKHGAVVDNIEELWVVTGHGDLRRCSDRRDALLFNSVLGGLGQFGIVVQVRLRLIEAKPLTRMFNIEYPDVATYLAKMTDAINDRFDHVEAQINPNGAGEYEAVTVLAAVHFHPSSPPNDAQLTAGLGAISVDSQDAPYGVFLERIDPIVEFLKAVGAWDVPHPWLDAFLPRATTGQFLDETFAQITAAESGNGLALLYPLRRSKFKRPMLRVPDTSSFFLFDILMFAPPIPEVVAATITNNTDLLERAEELGGKRYNIGSANYTTSHWKRHFKPIWAAAVLAKLAYDPLRLLTPGQGIF